MRNYPAIAAVLLSLTIAPSWALDGNVAAHWEAQGAMNAGSTTLPAGDYKLINPQKGIEYSLSIDEQGKMTVKDIRAAQTGTSSGTATVTAPAIPPAAPVGGTALPSGQPASTAAPAAVPSSQSQIESLVKGQIHKQLSKHGGQIQNEAQKLLNKLQ